ncbi:MULTISPECIES: hypothetical protein [unclassified Streptomyces]|uniref:hypothetical protein n=1 Tax=unclassified Streptomyces TaxID=2593676 RepID=UPI00117E98BC|nr:MULTISPECIES: hypothetical protein [unclassified Streptomyces]TRO59873.1 hypothetical protein E4K73_32685 [Streptomyces sp. IB201691-2A2]
MSTPEQVDDRLGRLLSIHPVAGGRYLSTGLKALAFALGGVLLMVFLIANPDFVLGQLLGLAVIPTIAGLPVAAIQLTRAVRSGRSEVYRLYENGLARHASGGTRSWTWDEVAVLHANPDTADEEPAQVPIERLARHLGRHFRCVVRFTDGARIRIDGYTADGPAIARALLLRRPDAAPQENTGKGPWVMLGTLPLVGAACAVPVVLIYQHLNSAGSDDTGDSTLVALALGMIVCLVATAAASALGARTFRSRTALICEYPSSPLSANIE